MAIGELSCRCPGGHAPVWFPATIEERRKERYGILRGSREGQLLRAACWKRSGSFLGARGCEHANSSWDVLGRSIQGAESISLKVYFLQTCCSSSFPHQQKKLQERGAPTNYRQPSRASAPTPAFKLKMKQPVVEGFREVEKGKYRLEVENIINTLSSLAPRGSVARCMDAFRNKITMYDFSLIFREFAQRGEYSKALRLFKYMQRQQWCKPNEHVYTIMIGILGREGMLDKASDLFEDMPNNEVEWNVYSFTALINAYGRNGQHESSLRLLARMKRERVTPNLITYNTVINACAKGGLEWEGLLSLFAQMRHEGIQPDIITYNTLLSACSSRGLVEQVGMVFRTMNEAGVVPDTLSYSSLVDTFSQAGRCEAAVELFKEMERAGNAPDVVAYNVLIEAYVKGGNILSASEVFKQMQNAGCSPNVGTFSILLEAYGKNGAYDQVRTLFRDMKDRGTDPDVGTYNTLIQVFGQGGYFREALNFFNDILEGEVEPDLQTYTGLLYSCGKGGLHKEAPKIYRHMVQRKIAPTNEVFTSLIKAYGKAAMYKEAESTFFSMEESGCEPDESTYSALIEAFAKGGLYKEAGVTVVNMYRAGLRADASIFNSLIEAFGKGGMFDDAIRFFRDMQSAQCQRNQGTYSSLLTVYCTAGLFDEAKAQFLEMKEGDFTPEVAAYCHMFSICVRRNRWEDANKVLEEMQGHHMPPSHGLVAGIIKGDYYERGSSWQMVEHMLDNLKVHGVGHNLDFYNALLEALWFSGQRDSARKILEESRKRGVYGEAFKKTRLMWSVDVHRMSTGAALTALLVWLGDMQIATTLGESVPALVSIVIKWGLMEKDRDFKELPLAKGVHSALGTLHAPFVFAPWNQSRIVSYKNVLGPWLADLSFPESLSLVNAPLASKSTPGRVRDSLQRLSIS